MAHFLVFVHPTDGHTAVVLDKPLSKSLMKAYTKYMDVPLQYVYGSRVILDGEDLEYTPRKSHLSISQKYWICVSSVVVLLTSLIALLGMFVSTAFILLFLAELFVVPVFCIIPMYEYEHRIPQFIGTIIRNKKQRMYEKFKNQVLSLSSGSEKKLEMLDWALQRYNPSSFRPTEKMFRDGDTIILNAITEDATIIALYDQWSALVEVKRTGDADTSEEARGLLKKISKTVKARVSDIIDHEEQIRRENEQMVASSTLQGSKSAIEGLLIDGGE